MKCVLYNVDDEEFVDYVVHIIKQRVLRNVNFKLLNNCKTFLVETYPELKYINMIRFLRQSLSTLIAVKYNDTYVIKFDPRKKYYGTDIPIETICELINYGVLDSKQNPIYSQAFEFVMSNIDKIKKVYEGGM